MYHYLLDTARGYDMKFANDVGRVMQSKIAHNAYDCQFSGGAKHLIIAKAVICGRNSYKKLIKVV